MGRIGVIFYIDEEIYVNRPVLNKLKIGKDKFLVFVDVDSLRGNYIIGDKLFKEKECDFFNMDKFGDFKEMFVFENSKFKFGKVCVAHQTTIDFEYLTFWFSALKYREMIELLTLNTLDSDFESLIKFRIFEILKCLKLDI